MYDATADPDCYPGTTVLRNKLGIRDQAALDAFEAVMVTQRFDEPMPAGRFSVRHYLALHRHLFGDVYPWAGRIRTTRIAKGANMFCYPENVAAELRRLFGELKRDRFLRDLAPREFARKAAHFLTELNAIHAFREGNGRTQLAFLTLLAAAAGHPLHHERIEPPVFLEAMIASFTGDERGLEDSIAELVRPAGSR